MTSDAAPEAGDAGRAGDAGDAAPAALACSLTIQQFCAQTDPGPGVVAARCDANLATARSDQRLCGGLGGEQSCGTYDVVVAAGIDSGDLYYYASAGGMLVAVVGYFIPGGRSCIAGPPSFTPPAAASCGAVAHLPVCP